MTGGDAFAKLGFEKFRAFAKDESLSKYERIGFPDSYRQGHEQMIFADICIKLSKLNSTGCHVLDIGPGCSDLPLMLLSLCSEHQHFLTLIDSTEMLARLPDAAFVDKVAAMFPNCPDWLNENRSRFDAILCYSVLHYVLVDTAFFRFLDDTLSLLAPGGQLLIGDVPNVSKRKRFFASEAGVAFHKDFMETDESPIVAFNTIEHDQIDDAVVFSLLQRARAQGFDAYLVPQNKDLPMANRREDILILRP